MKALTRRVGVVAVAAGIGIATLSGCTILGSANDSASNDAASGDGVAGVSEEPAGDDADNADDAGTGDLAKAPANINGIGQDSEYDCGGQDIAINASSATIHLAGSCGEVAINGEGLEVTIDNATSIIVNGANLEVFYGGSPTILNNGVNVEVSPL